MRAGTDIWSALRPGCDGLRQPVLVQDFFCDPVIRDEEIGEVLRGRPPLMNVFAEGGESPALLSRVTERPPRPGEGMEAWTQGTFGSAPFGIVLANAEAVCEPLARRFASLLAPMVSANGLRYSGISISLFIGNYGFTPFGIHHDKDMHLLHAHVAGRKEMYLWDPERYVELNGRPDFCHRPEELVPHADHRFVLEPGSLLYFPGHFYHIGNSPELSIGVAVVLPDISQEGLLGHAFGDAVIDLLEELDLPAGAELELDPSSLERAVASLCQAGTAARWIDETVEGLRLSCLSNAGLGKAPQARKTRSSELEQRSLQRVSPFQMQCQELADHRLAIHVRRTRILTRNVRAVADVVSDFNDGKVLDAEECLQRLEAQLPTRDAQEFLVQLVERRGVDLVERRV